MIEKKRIVAVAIGTFFLFSLLILQFFKIQIIEGEHWSKEALSQHEFIVHEPFRRGTFYSDDSRRKNHPASVQPLVFDVVKYHLFADPQLIPSSRKREIVEALAGFLPSEDEGGLFNELGRQSRCRKLARWVEKDVHEEIQKWWVSFSRSEKIPRNALYFITDYQRSYPYGKLLGQVLHTIRDLKDENTREGVPTGGLEAHFNSLLKGKKGKRKLLRSPLNSLETDQIIELPQNGADIFLTIDHTIQAIVEEELEKGVKAARAKGGWAVMMDPQTGEIIAMAQYPFFDPRHYSSYFNHPEKMESAKVKSISDAFELGSIMKPITMAICLQANAERQARGESALFDPDEKLEVTRTHFPGRASKPLRDPAMHTYLNLDMALQKSSNIYMAEVVDRVIQSMGNGWYRKKLMEHFGFGQKTGIELPAETAGMVPEPGKFYLTGAPEWSLSTPYSLAIGYNLLSTSMQMARAFAVFANGGKLVTPTLVKKITRTDCAGKTEALYDASAQREKFPRVLDTAVTEKIVHGLKFSTKPGGTGWRAEVHGYTEAGKTGTAEKIENGLYSKQRYISSFVGFSPARPDQQHRVRFVLVVSIDEALPIRLEDGIKNYSGGKCAAPVFRAISERTLEYIGEEPDDPHGYPRGDPRFDPEKADWFKEVKELKMLYEQWNKKKV